MVKRKMYKEIIKKIDDEKYKINTLAISEAGKIKKIYIRSNSIIDV